MFDDSGISFLSVGSGNVSGGKGVLALEMSVKGDVISLGTGGGIG